MRIALHCMKPQYFFTILYGDFSVTFYASPVYLIVECEEPTESFYARVTCYLLSLICPEQFSTFGVTFKLIISCVLELRYNRSPSLESLAHFQS